MKIRTGIKKRDELVVCIRDMVFVIAGTILVVSGHIGFAIAAFVAACIRLDIMPAVTFAKMIRNAKNTMRLYGTQVKELRKTVFMVLDTGVSRGILTEEEAKTMKEKLKNA